MRATITIAIFWLFAYGFGSEAASCCGVTTKACDPTGIRTPLTSKADGHCHSAPRHRFSIPNVDGDGAWSAVHDFNGHTACCPARPCKPLDFTACLGQSPPSSPDLQVTGNIYETKYHYNNIFPANNPLICNQTIPIYLLTKSIIC